MIDQENAAFIQTGVSISIASCDPDGLATMARGVGCKVLHDGRVAVFVIRSQAEVLLKNILSTKKVANVFSLPSSNRTVQLKGIDAEILPFDSADLPIIQTHIDDFLLEVLPLGMPESVIRTVYAHTKDELVTIVYSPSAAFSQTPGPKAGEPLGKAS